MKYRAIGTSRKKICDYVYDIKKQLGLENELHFPILKFAENILPQIIEGYNFIVVDNDEMGDKHGETIPSELTVKIRNDIYYSAVAGNGRDRLTIAHEIGHLLMHNEKYISLCRLEPGQDLPAYEDPEWQANCFAGELLASSYLIRDMDIEDVAIKCGVSLDAANIQLKHAKIF